MVTSQARLKWTNNKLINLTKASSLTFFLLSIHGASKFSIFSTRVEIFHIIPIISNSIYRVEISAGDENLHTISPLNEFPLVETDFLSSWNSILLFRMFFLLVETEKSKITLFVLVETDFLAGGNFFFF